VTARPSGGSSGALSRPPGAVVQGALVPLLQFPGGAGCAPRCRRGAGTGWVHPEWRQEGEGGAASGGMLCPEVAEAAVLLAEPLLGALDAVQRKVAREVGVSADLSVSVGMGVWGEVGSESESSDNKGEMVSVVKVLLLRAALLRVADSRHAHLLQDIQHTSHTSLPSLHPATGTRFPARREGPRDFPRRSSWG